MKTTIEKERDKAIEALNDIYTHIVSNHEEIKDSHSDALQILEDVEYISGRFYRRKVE
jgi:uncharacterized protein YutE (UPF0331/DUF86 family)